MISVYRQVNAQKPIYEYFNSRTTLEELNDFTEGNYRILSINGREGINTESIHSRLILPNHTLDKPQGSVQMWVASLEDLSAYVPFGKMNLNNKHHWRFPLLSTNENPQNTGESSFKWFWQPHWHAPMRMLWHKGSYYFDTFQLPNYNAFVIGDFHFKKSRWYQFTFTWNHSEGDYRLYINGILIGTSPEYTTSDTLNYEPVDEDAQLYSGSPMLCYSDIKFYDKVLDEEVITVQYKKEATDFNEKEYQDLLSIHSGLNKPNFEFRLDNSWENKLDLSLMEETHLDSFYVQGYTNAVSITKEGLRMQTPQEYYEQKQLEDQVYCWTWKTFEGDIYIEYEFKVNKRGGLSLLMFNASGMNREDFMKDYELRTSGSMRMVAWEDIRNYHWEYYRDMVDVRNDVLSSAMLKNPFQMPIGYSTLSDTISSGEWHKLQLFQQGDHIIGAIDGKVMIDGHDNAHTNNGPVYNYGHIAIRCMIRSNVTFRNLKVYNKDSYEEIEAFTEK